jgi:hypothetical protein
VAGAPRLLALIGPFVSGKGHSRTRCTDARARGPDHDWRSFPCCPSNTMRYKAEMSPYSVAFSTRAKADLDRVSGMGNYSSLRRLIEKSLGPDGNIRRIHRLPDADPWRCVHADGYYAFFQFAETPNEHPTATRLVDASASSADYVKEAAGARRSSARAQDQPACDRAVAGRTRRA